MIINRHNYEECFILYWDNELTVPQKQAVENFVKENADLQEEFKLLGETRFTPDDHVQLEEKEFLLNNSFINITNYEEQLLNYIDDEVTTEQRKEVEKFVSQYSVGKQELALLQKTKLQPEAERVFPDKSILYRREEKVRVISMTWFRVAVAAAIILIAGFATFRLVNSNNNGNIPSVASVDQSKNQPLDKKADQPVTGPKDKILKDQGQTIVKTDKKSTGKQTVVKKNNEKTVKENSISNTSTAYQPENKNNLPKERKSIDKNIAEPTETAAIPKSNNNKVQKIESDKTNLLDNSSVTKSLSPSFANISTGDDDNFGKKEKGGLKEFLRKTTRVFERRTKIQTTTDDNKLLLGAFAVSLK